MKRFTYFLMCLILFSSCTKENSDNEIQTGNRVLCNNSEQGLYEINAETGESTLLIGYNYIEMYDPVFVKNKNRLIIPGCLNWNKLGFISIDLKTMAITEFQNSNCWKDFELNTITGKMYSSNFDQGLYEINPETGESTLLIKYKYNEMYKPLFIPTKNRLVIPGNLRNNIHGFISIDLNTMKIIEFQNEDCWKNLVLNPLNDKIYSSNYSKGLFEVDIETGKSKLLLSYDYREMYKPGFIDQGNKLVIPGFMTNYDNKKGFITIGLQDHSIKEFFNTDCYKNFVVL